MISLVIATIPDNGRYVQTQCAPSSTVRDIISKWSEQLNPSDSDPQSQSEHRQPLDGNSTLEELLATSRGSGAVVLVLKDPTPTFSSTNRSVNITTSSKRQIVYTASPGTRSVSFNDLKSFYQNEENRFGRSRNVEASPIVFCCNGCSRRISDNELPQKVPADCCKEASLSLTVTSSDADEEPVDDNESAVMNRQSAAKDATVSAVRDSKSIPIRNPRAPKESSRGAAEKKKLPKNRCLVSLKEKKEIFKTNKGLFNFSADEFNLSERKYIAEGGFATVFSVDYLGSKPRTKCALKVVLTKRIDKREVLLHSVCDDERIIQFYGCLKYSDFTGCVLEFAQHGSIHDVLIEHKSALPITVDLKLKWTKDIVGALVYLHNEQSPHIYHGDIKSRNILICSKPDGQTIAKLADFGLSRELEKTTTYPGGGTPLWTAPEVLTYKGKSLKSDVWSFGVTATEIFTERPPYQNARDSKVSNDDIIIKVTNGLTNAFKDLNEEEVGKLPRALALILPLTLETLRHRRCTMTNVADVLSKEDETSMMIVYMAVRRFCDLPRELHVSAVTPSGQKGNKTIPTDGERDLGALLKYSQEQLQMTISFDAVSFSKEILYDRDGMERRAIRSRKEENDVWLDTEDGEQIEETKAKTFIRRFLSSESAPPPPNDHPAVIKILTECDVVEMTPDGHVTAPLPPTAICDCRFVLMLFGVRAGERLFLQTDNGYYCDSQSGESVWRRQNIPGKQRKRSIIVMLPEGRAPKIKVLEKKVLRTYWRSKVSIIDNLIAAAPPSGSSNCWRRSSNSEADFDDTFTNACWAMVISDGDAQKLLFPARSL